MSTLEFVPTTKNNILALTKVDFSSTNPRKTQEEFTQSSQPQPQPQKNIDPVFHFYLGSMSVVGLFILFRMIQKN